MLKNPDKLRLSYIKRQYGLDKESYYKLYSDQNGSCAICKSKVSLHKYLDDSPVAHVDHCHITGKVRGLLCPSCNKGIGHLKDSSLICKLAVEYLEKGSS